MPAIRVATERDAPEIAAIVNAAFQVENDFRAGDRTSVAEISGRIRSEPQSGIFLIAIQQLRIVGAVQVQIIDEHTGYLGMLAVDPSQQRSGIGRGLLEAAEDHCRQRGCTQMTLSTGSVRRELFPYYQKFGYRVTSIGPAPAGAPFTKPIDIVTMSKPL